MIAEQELGKLQDVKARVEMLIRYFRNTGTTEAELVEDLEERLRGVCDALRGRTSASAC